MFEGSLVESRGLMVSPAKRWTAVGSAMVQCAVAALLVAVPLMHPQLPPMLPDSPRLFTPLPPKPPVTRVDTTATTSSTAMSVPVTVQTISTAVNTPGMLQRPIGQDMEHGPVITGIRMGNGGPLSITLIGTGSDMVAAVAATPARRPGPTLISSGVSAGMLLTPIQPAYPAIAKAAGVQGSVVMEAVISKAGRIESLRATSGPPMLRQAALDAVQSARYQPYRLNGEPTEVQTTITVNFRLGN